MSFTVVQDSREKYPISFAFFDDCKETVVEKIDEGDYTTREIQALEEKLGLKLLSLERKATTGELSLNLGNGLTRFTAEIKRMCKYKRKYLIFEFDISTLLDFPVGSGIPKNRWTRKNKAGKTVKALKMNGNYMLSILQGFQDNYGIEIIYAGNKAGAAQESMRIFNEVYDAYKDKVPG